MASAIKATVPASLAAVLGRHVERREAVPAPAISDWRAASRGPPRDRATAGGGASRPRCGAPGVPDHLPLPQVEANKRVLPDPSPSCPSRDQDRRAGDQGAVHVYVAAPRAPPPAISGELDAPSPRRTCRARRNEFYPPVSAMVLSGSARARFRRARSRPGRYARTGLRLAHDSGRSLSSWVSRVDQLHGRAELDAVPGELRPLDHLAREIRLSKLQDPSLVVGLGFLGRVDTRLFYGQYRLSVSFCAALPSIALDYRFALGPRGKPWLCWALASAPLTSFLCNSGP